MIFVVVACLCLLCTGDVQSSLEVVTQTTGATSFEIFLKNDAWYSVKLHNIVLYNRDSYEIYSSEDLVDPYYKVAQKNITGRVSLNLPPASAIRIAQFFPNHSSSILSDSFAWIFQLINNKKLAVQVIYSWSICPEFIFHKNCQHKLQHSLAYKLDNNKK